jgi:hypothetical protein
MYTLTMSNVTSDMHDGIHNVDRTVPVCTSWVAVHAQQVAMYYGARQHHLHTTSSVSANVHVDRVGPDGH